MSTSSFDRISKSLVSTKGYLKDNDESTSSLDTRNSKCKTDGYQKEIGAPLFSTDGYPKQTGVPLIWTDGYPKKIGVPPVSTDGYPKKTGVMVDSTNGYPKDTGTSIGLTQYSKDIRESSLDRICTGNSSTSNRNTGISKGDLWSSNLDRIS